MVHASKSAATHLGLARCLVTVIRIERHHGPQERGRERSEDLEKCKKAFLSFAPTHSNVESSEAQNANVGAVFSMSLGERVVRMRALPDSSIEGPFLLELVELADAQLACSRLGFDSHGSLGIEYRPSNTIEGCREFAEIMMRRLDIQDRIQEFGVITIEDEALSTLLEDPSLTAHGELDDDVAEMMQHLISTDKNGVTFIDYRRGGELQSPDDFDFDID